jgi:hypothetical protein
MLLGRQDTFRCGMMCPAGGGGKNPISCVLCPPQCWGLYLLELVAALFVLNP